MKVKNRIFSNNTSRSKKLSQQPKPKEYQVIPISRDLVSSQMASQTTWPRAWSAKI